jgi:hypothetical protein
VLVEQAGKATATDKDSVDKCIVLAGLIRDHIKAIDAERETVKAPHLAQCREIDNHYHGIEGLLVRYDGRRRPIGGPLFDVVRLVDDYRKEQERIAEERRQASERAAEEARRKAQEAEERQRAAEREALAATEPADEEAARRRAAEEGLESERLQREAKSFDRHAEVVQQPGPIKTAYGMSARRRPVYKVEITNLTEALRHCRKVNETALMERVQTIYEAQVRAGVRTLPGAKITEDSATTIRTR